MDVAAARSFRTEHAGAACRCCRATTIHARSLAEPSCRAAVHGSEGRSGRARRRALSRLAGFACRQGLVHRPAPALTVEASVAAVTAAADEARKHNLPLIVHATG